MSDEREPTPDALVEQLESLDIEAIRAASDRAAEAAERADDESLRTWLATPEAGWSSVIAPQALAAATFLGGGAEDRLRVRYFRRESDGAMMGKAWFGPMTQGPPGHAHGGSMASLLDESMGGAAWIAGHPVLAGELNTRFLRMLPLGTRCVVEAKVESIEGRKVTASATLASAEGTRFALGRGIFIELDPARSSELLDKIARYFGRDGV